jgi:hypothetical protein
MSHMPAADQATRGNHNRCPALPASHGFGTGNKQQNDSRCLGANVTSRQPWQHYLSGRPPSREFLAGDRLGYNATTSCRTPPSRGLTAEEPRLRNRISAEGILRNHEPREEIQDFRTSFPQKIVPRQWVGYACRMPLGRMWEPDSANPASKGSR